MGMEKSKGRGLDILKENVELLICGNFSSFHRILFSLRSNRLSYSDRLRGRLNLNSKSKSISLLVLVLGLVLLRSLKKVVLRFDLMNW